MERLAYGQSDTKMISATDHREMARKPAFLAELVKNKVRLLQNKPGFSTAKMLRRHTAKNAPPPSQGAGTLKQIYNSYQKI